MKATRIEWLHRLGVDVWKLRDSPVSTSEKSESQHEEAQIEPANTIVGFGSKSKSYEAHVSQEVGRTPLCNKSSELGSIEDEKHSRDSLELLEDTDEPSFELQCLFLGACLIVFNPNEQNSQTMATGIGRALCNYQPTSPESVNFRWPPVHSEGPSAPSRHGGWDSASRAFRSLVKSHEWAASTLVTVGIEANRVTESLLASDTVLLKLDEFPTDATSKRELWIRMTEML